MPVSYLVFPWDTHNMCNFPLRLKFCSRWPHPSQLLLCFILVFVFLTYFRLQSIKVVSLKPLKETESDKLTNTPYHITSHFNVVQHRFENEFNAVWNMRAACVCFQLLCCRIWYLKSWFWHKTIQLHNGWVWGGCYYFDLCTLIQVS